jgi:hypothetical protein
MSYGTQHITEFLAEKVLIPTLLVEDSKEKKVYGDRLEQCVSFMNIFHHIA